ncbi:hypothetical protein MP228_011724 [Amoeboaphelidium protococcarum]|nr:hypothetical protein MP228_011724 [Amoeboaphelidium protococcarum]
MDLNTEQKQKEKDDALQQAPQLSPKKRSAHISLPALDTKMQQNRSFNSMAQNNRVSPVGSQKSSGGGGVGIDAAGSGGVSVSNKRSKSISKEQQQQQQHHHHHHHHQTSVSTSNTNTSGSHSSSHAGVSLQNNSSSLLRYNAANDSQIGSQMFHASSPQSSSVARLNSLLENVKAVSTSYSAFPQPFQSITGRKVSHDESLEGYRSSKTIRPRSASTHDKITRRSSLASTPASEQAAPASAPIRQLADAFGLSLHSEGRSGSVFESRELKSTAAQASTWSVASGPIDAITLPALTQLMGSRPTTPSRSRMPSNAFQNSQQAQQYSSSGGQNVNINFADGTFVEQKTLAEIESVLQQVKCAFQSIIDSRLAASANLPGFTSAVPGNSGMVHSYSWPSSINLSEHDQMLLTVMGICKKVLSLNMADIQGTSIVADLQLALVNMLDINRQMSYKDDNVEDIISKLIFEFSPLARLVEYYKQYSHQMVDEDSRKNSKATIDSARRGALGQAATSLSRAMSGDSINTTTTADTSRLVSDLPNKSPLSSIGSRSGSDDSISSSVQPSPRLQHQQNMAKSIATKLLVRKSQHVRTTKSPLKVEEADFRRKSSVLKPVGETGSSEESIQKQIISAPEVERTISDSQKIDVNNEGSNQSFGSNTNLAETAKTAPIQSRNHFQSENDVSTGSDIISRSSTGGLRQDSASIVSQPSTTKMHPLKERLNVNPTASLTKLFRSLRSVTKSPDTPAQGRSTPQTEMASSLSSTMVSSSRSNLPNNVSKLVPSDDSDEVICRICEYSIPSQDFQRHSQYCAAQQECEMRREDCDRELHKILVQLSNVSQEESSRKSDDSLLTAIEKALQVKEHSKDAISKLHKYLSRVASPTSPVSPNPNKSELVSKAYRLIEAKLKIASEYKEKVYPLLKVNSAEKSSRLRKSSAGSSVSAASAALRRVSDNEIKSGQRQSKPFVSLFAALLKNQRTRTSSVASADGLGREKKTKMPCIQDFEIVKPISKGAFGRVYVAKKKLTGDLYAMKILKKEDMIRKNMVHHVLAERKVLSLSNAPFVVKLFYAFQSKHYLYLVMEYVVGGDLSSLLHNLGRFPEEMAKVYAGEAVVALQYLHSNGIIHRDIKPDNMLITQDGHLKLTDFGLAKIDVNAAQSTDPATFKATMRRRRKSVSVQKAKQEELQTLMQQNLSALSAEDKAALGTPDYLAPELLTGLSHNAAVDWWSLGICIYEFLVGIPPFNDDSPEQIFQNILQHKPIEFFDDGEELEEELISVAAKDLICGFLEYDPSQRLKPPAIQQHPFFDGYNFEDVTKNEPPFIPQVTQGDDTSYFVDRNAPLSEAASMSSLSEQQQPPHLLKPSGSLEGYSSEHDIINQYIEDQVTLPNDDTAQNESTGSLLAPLSIRNKHKSKLLQQDSILAGVKADLDSEMEAQSMSSSQSLSVVESSQQSKNKSRRSGLYSFILGKHAATAQQSNQPSELSMAQSLSSMSRLDQQSVRTGKGVDKAARWIATKIRDSDYSWDQWSQHKLHPKIGQKFKSGHVLGYNDVLNWIFLSDLLNYSFWCDPQSVYKVTYDGVTYSGYWTLHACINRALDEGHNLLDVKAMVQNCDYDLFKSIFRGNDPDIEMPLIQTRYDNVMEAYKIMLQQFDAQFSNIVAAGNRNSQNLISIMLEHFPTFRDESRFQLKDGSTMDVYLYKRVQILVADVYAAFKSYPEYTNGDTDFLDIDSITMFADYRVPQCLLAIDVLSYSQQLNDVLRKGGLIENGDHMEVEIRANSVIAVEKIVDRIRVLHPDLVHKVNAILVDFFLWDYAKLESHSMSDIPIHKTRCIYY